MTWDEVLSTLVGFVGRDVHVQQWNTTDPEADGAVPIVTAFGVLTKSHAESESMMPSGGLLVHLAKGAEVSAAVTLRGDLFESAELLDADRLEIAFSGALLGVYAE